MDKGLLVNATAFRFIFKLFMHNVLRMRSCMDNYNEELGLKIPSHVAVILDGNGRWAKKKHMPRTYGHMQGSKVVEDMLYVADEL